MSSFLKKILLASGANRSANSWTSSLKVAEKRTFWTLGGRSLVSCEQQSALWAPSSIFNKNQVNVLLDPESLFTQTLLCDQFISLVKNQHPDHPRVQYPWASHQHVHQGTGGTDEDLLVDSGITRPRARDGEESADLGELTDLVYNFLNLTGKFSGRSDTDGLETSNVSRYNVAKNKKDNLLEGWEW